MTTPQNAPAGKHHATANEVGDAERAGHAEHARTRTPRTASTACRWSGWSTSANATAR